MKIIGQSFPHPVLGIQDDVSGIFKTDFTWSCDREYYHLNPTFDLQNATLESLLKEKKAIFAIHVECDNTFFRETCTSYERMPNIRINANKLRDKVEISFYIITASFIPDYQIIGSNEDYEDRKFQIEKGDVLAYGGSTTFLAVKNYESLKAVSTIMIVKKGDYESGQAKVDFNNDKIQLYLSKEDFTTYRVNLNSEHFKTLFHTTLVLPILYKALHYIKQGDFSEYKWFLVLKTRIDDENLSVEDDERHFEVIQKLFGSPITRFFETITYLSEEIYG